MLDSSNELLEIQKLQFRDRQGAELRLAAHLRILGMSDVENLTLNVKPESLNSINGIATFSDGSKLFFKSHIEENEKLSEYYNSQLLADAGYPMVLPKRIKTTPGEQIAFYDIISFPTLFDLTYAEELNQLNTQTCTSIAPRLVSAQESLDQNLFQIYQTTFANQGSSSSTSSPIHQLFSERLSPDGRLGMFYLGKKLSFKENQIPIASFFGLRWRINGVDYQDSIADLIARAQRELNPALKHPTIIGHGDAHNGNVFWDDQNDALLYFDPAFAGRHSPLLDLTKPFFHNVFAKWMYFPDAVSKSFSLSYKIKGNTIELEHSFLPSSLRRKYFDSKINYLLKPILQELQSRDELPNNWRDFLKSALFCCPLLTVNLAANFNSTGKLAETYPENIKLLGFAMAIEMGANFLKGSSSMRELCEQIENAA